MDTSDEIIGNGHHLRWETVCVIQSTDLCTSSLIYCTIVILFDDSLPLVHMQMPFFKFVERRRKQEGRKSVLPEMKHSQVLTYQVIDEH